MSRRQDGDEAVRRPRSRCSFRAVQGRGERAAIWWWVERHRLPASPPRHPAAAGAGREQPEAAAPGAGAQQGSRGSGGGGQGTTTVERLPRAGEELEEARAEVEPRDDGCGEFCGGASAVQGPRGHL